MFRYTSVVALFFCLVASPNPLIAQSAHLIPIESGYYSLIQHLQDRGYLRELNPIDAPYSESEIRQALDSVDRSALGEPEITWIQTLDEVLFSPASTVDAVVGIRYGPGLRASNNGRLEQNRYLTGRSEHVWEFAYIQGRMALGGFAGALGVRHDLYYDRDPDGIDSALRWLIRSEDGYIRYQSHFFSVSLGRFSRHWGRISDEALLVSRNPRSYDQISLKVGGSRLYLRAVLGELDSITGDGRFTGTAGADSVRSGSERRYLAAHRLDWRPHPDVTISVMQSTLYSGANAGLSLKYANPLTPVIVALDNVPKNDENNGLFGFSVLWRRPRTVLFAQAVLDDADVLNLTEPTSFSAVGSASFIRVRPSLDLTTGIAAVASRTYNTVQAEGRYIYLLRGLATQFSDFVTWYAQADWYLYRSVAGLTLSPRLDVLWQGEQDIRNAFPGSSVGVGTILTGTPERTIRAALRASYEPNARFFVRIDAGVNQISDYTHISGRNRFKFLAAVEFGIRLMSDRIFDPGF